MGKVKERGNLHIHYPESTMGVFAFLCRHKSSLLFSAAREQGCPVGTWCCTPAERHGHT